MDNEPVYKFDVGDFTAYCQNVCERADQKEAMHAIHNTILRRVAAHPRRWHYVSLLHGQAAFVEQAYRDGHLDVLVVGSQSDNMRIVAVRAGERYRVIDEAYVLNMLQDEEDGEL